MKQKTVRIIKIVLGAYLTFIGSVHFINIYAQKPGDMQLQIAIALFYILIGAAYMIKNVQKIWEKAIKAKMEEATKQKEEEEKRRYRELHSNTKFRTAPMRIVEPIDLEKAEENLEEFEEERIIITNYNEEADKQTETEKNKITETKMIEDEVIENKIIEDKITKETTTDNKEIGIVAIDIIESEVNEEG